MELHEYTGTVSKFIFQAEDFAIFKFKTSSGDFTALGDIFDVNEGEKLFIKGSWEKHPKYGKQLRVKTWEKIIPTDRENAIELLSSGMIKGVGPATAENIVNTLGPNAIEIILESPERLTEVKGIGKKKAQKISQQVSETYDAQRTVSDLVALGITPRIAYKAYQKFGRSTAEYVRKNPYCLTEIEQVGFIKADEIAQKIGIKRDSPFRVEAGVLYILNEALWNEGHTYLPRDKLIRKSLELLNKEYDDVTEEQINQALNNEEICTHEKGVSLKWAVNFEKQIAQNIKRLCRKLSNISPLPVIRSYESKYKIKLTDKQKQAVEMALNHGLSVLTGGPGVGKTATVKAIISVYKKIKPGAVIKLAAPTGRAARRMAETTGKHASTLHRLLNTGYDGKPYYNKDNPLPCDFLIIDEVSMMDIVLAKRTLEALKTGTRVLLVGDVDQLPSVGPGNVLRDILTSQVPRVTLDKIFRQAAESQIITNAHRINKGQRIIIDHSKRDFFFLDRDELHEINRTILYCVKKLGYSIMDVQVLSPMKKGPAGTQELNKAIQEAVNPKGKELKLSTRAFRVGDKVIQTRNNYDKKVFNGDIGIIKKITEDSVIVKFNGDEIEYTYNELNDLDLAYAITVHKSQGSEFKAVIIPLTTSHYIMLARNLIYTAITRAREKVVLVGTRKALAIAVENNKPVQRYTLLNSYLTGCG